MKLFRGFFFLCLPVELQYRVCISFLHKLTSLVEINAKFSNPLQWLPRCLRQAACQGSPTLPGSPYPLRRPSTLQVWKAATACCVIGFVYVCSLRMLFLFVGRSYWVCVFVPSCEGGSQIKKLDSSSLYVRPYGRAPWGRRVGGGQSRAGVCAKVAGEAGSVQLLLEFILGFLQYWEFCGSLAGECWATVVTWGLSNCRQLSAATPRSSLRSRSPRAGTAMLLGTLDQSLNLSGRH